MTIWYDPATEVRSPSECAITRVGILWAGRVTLKAAQQWMSDLVVQVLVGSCVSENSLPLGLGLDIDIRKL